MSNYCLQFIYVNDMEHEISSRISKFDNQIKLNHYLASDTIIQKLQRTFVGLEIDLASGKYYLAEPILRACILAIVILKLSTFYNSVLSRVQLRKNLKVTITNELKILKLFIEAKKET